MNPTGNESYTSILAICFSQLKLKTFIKTSFISLLQISSSATVRLHHCQHLNLLEYHSFI